MRCSVVHSLLQLHALCHRHFGCRILPEPVSCSPVSLPQPPLPLCPPPCVCVCVCSDVEALMDRACQELQRGHREDWGVGVL